MSMIDTRFAKIVTDLDGRHHILIEGRVISLQGPLESNNEMVEVIVTGLRTPAPLTGMAHAASDCIARATAGATA